LNYLFGDVKNYLYSCYNKKIADYLVENKIISFTYKELLYMEENEDLVNFPSCEFYLIKFIK